MTNERHRHYLDLSKVTAQATPSILARLKDNIETTFSELDRSITQSMLPTHIKDELLIEKKAAYDTVIRHLYSMWQARERKFKSLHKLLERLNVSRREIIEASAHAPLEPIVDEVKNILSEMQELEIFM